MRAVYADMLTLFPVLIQVEGRHASRNELGLVHTPEYLDEVEGWVEEATRHGRPIHRGAGLVVSGATWDASTAAVGCVLAGIDAVAEGGAANAFCAIRPPARDARPDRAGLFGVFNHLAIGARYLRRRMGTGRVAIVEWMGRGGIGSVEVALGEDEGVTLAPVTVPTVAPRGRRSEDAASPRKTPNPKDGAVDGRAGARESLLESTRSTLEMLAESRVDFLLLSASFEGLPNDPIAPGPLHPTDFYDATVLVREFADAACGGRMVSVLEGGMDSAGTAAAVVQHLRALAGLERADRS